MTTPALPEVAPAIPKIEINTPKDKTALYLIAGGVVALGLLYVYARKKGVSSEPKNAES